MTTQLVWSSPNSHEMQTLIVGHLDTIRQHKEALLPQLPSMTEELWNSLLGQLNPKDKGSSISTWIAGEPGHAYILGALPTACSRHNSPAHPHELTAFLDKQLSSKCEEQRLLVLLDRREDALANAAALARALPTYSRKTKPSDETTLYIEFFCESERLESTDGLESTAQSVQLSAHLVDSPTNELHTQAFVQEARDIATMLGASCTVIEGTDLREQGFGGLWGVGRTATHPPALVILEHNPAEPASDKTFVWVGKGIVYDTGGLSIKSKTGMPGMKSDMGGAAAVLGAFSTAVQMDFPHRLCALLCLAENSVGPDSLRPDDIITLYSGRTVEVNNTDAEGRLVLGDGVAYATRHLNPDVLFDLATLTGAQLMATGRRHAGLMSNREDWENYAVEIGKKSGDLVHPLPYCPEFFRSEFKSQVADMKNSVKDRANAQSSCAGQFVGEHLVDYEGAWLHIDLAGPGRSKERGTGYGVALLLAMAGFTPEQEQIWAPLEIF